MIRRFQNPRLAKRGGGGQSVPRVFGGFDKVFKGQPKVIIAPPTHTHKKIFPTKAANDHSPSICEHFPRDYFDHPKCKFTFFSLTVASNIYALFVAKSISLPKLVAPILAMPVYRQRLVSGHTAPP